MKLQILFVSLVALVGLGCCEGAEKDNIFHVKYEDKISLEKLERKLKENTSKMEAETVAGLLAQASPKNRKSSSFAYYSLDDLLEMAEISMEKPLETCDRDQFLALIEMCHRFTLFEDVDTFRGHLSEFCKPSIKKRFEFCAGQVGKIAKLTDKKTLFGEEIIEFSKKFSAWIEYRGDENATDDVNLKKYRRTSSCDNRQIAKSCSAFNELLKENLLFFDEDGKKTSAYFATDKEAALLRDRCKIFLELTEADAGRKRLPEYGLDDA